MIYLLGIGAVMSSIAHGSASMVYLLMVRWMKAGLPHESCCRKPNSCHPQSLPCVALINSMSLRQEKSPAAGREQDEGGL